jgi:hypothetical protein
MKYVGVSAMDNRIDGHCPVIPNYCEECFIILEPIANSGNRLTEAAEMNAGEEIYGSIMFTNLYDSY